MHITSAEHNSIQKAKIMFTHNLTVLYLISKKKTVSYCMFRCPQNRTRLSKNSGVTRIFCNASILIDWLAVGKGSRAFQKSAIRGMLNRLSLAVAFTVVCFFIFHLTLLTSLLRGEFHVALPLSPRDAGGPLRRPLFSRLYIVGNLFFFFFFLRYKWSFFLFFRSRLL